MKNVYLVLGGVAIAVVAFIGGTYYDRFQGAVSTVEGVIVARDNTSITIRTSDDTVRSVSIAGGALVVGQPESVEVPPEALVPGSHVVVTLSQGAASTVVITPFKVPTAQ